MELLSELLIFTLSLKGFVIHCKTWTDCIAGGCPGKRGSQSEELEKSQRRRWGWNKKVQKRKISNIEAAPVRQVASFPTRWLSWPHTWQSCNNLWRKKFKWKKVLDCNKWMTFIAGKILKWHPLDSMKGNGFQWCPTKRSNWFKQTFRSIWVLNTYWATTWGAGRFPVRRSAPLSLGSTATVPRFPASPASKN